MKRRLILLAGVLMLQGCGGGQSLPPLLRDATAGGGTNLLCDPLASGGAGSTPETAPRSPEIQARLDRDFPPGSPEAALIAELKNQGFEIRRCQTDAAIGIAEFYRKGDGAASATLAAGRIMWRKDPKGQLEWTNGNIAYTGP